MFIRVGQEGCSGFSFLCFAHFENLVHFPVLIPELGHMYPCLCHIDLQVCKAHQVAIIHNSSNCSHQYLLYFAFCKPCDVKEPVSLNYLVKAMTRR